MTKHDLVSFFFEKNYMVSPNVLNSINENFDFETFFDYNKSLEKTETVVVIDEIMFENFLPKKKEEVKYEDSVVPKVEVIFSYEDKPKKREVKDFVLYMKARYQALKNILLQRSELQGAVSINRALNKSKNDPVALIAFVDSINQTKNGHYILELEDLTGKIKCLVSASNEKVLPLMDQIVLDEVVGIVGNVGDNIVFAKDLLFPDFPVKSYKRCKDDVSVVFAADFHIGSDMFSEKEFERFIEWINGDYGTEKQKEVASKVKYLIIPGDLIEGVGIYPNQQKELAIDDIYEQYEKVAEYLSLIRKDIKIVICGGNHDALRLAEPQPKLSEDFARSLYKLKNVVIVSNPGIVKIHGLFEVMLYHGYGFDYYVNNVNHLRDAGGYENSLAIMEFFLRKRHLSPTHMSSLYIPDIEKDPLVIERIPDFFVTGHLHYDFNVSTYKNVTLVGCSSFQYKTSFQEKLGHTHIDWGSVAVINLKSREVKIVDFKDEKKEKS